MYVWLNTVFRLSLWIGLISKAFAKYVADSLTIHLIECGKYESFRSGSKIDEKEVQMKGRRGTDRKANGHNWGREEIDMTKKWATGVFTFRTKYV